MKTTKLMKNKVSIAVAFAIASLATSALAQTTADESQKEQQPEEIVITGMRASLEKSLEIKRESTGVVDAIVAEDIGKFPESNVAEALQRIPGIYLSRDGNSNEGNRINIRGLGPEFAVTTINGAPVHTTSAANVGGSTRDFNYDVFPSDLFGGVNVYKTPLAELNEGGIGGVVDLQTPRPFSNPGQQIHYSAIGMYNTASEKTSPRGSFLYSNTWDNFGVLVGVAVADAANQRSGFEATGSYNTSALGSQNPPKGYSLKLDYTDPRANLGSYTQAQVDNAFLPRFARAYASQNDRQRNAEVVSLQYKDDKLDVGIDTLFSKLTDATDEYTFGAAIRNSGTGSTPGMVPVNIFIDQNNNLNGTFANASYFGESFIYDGETKFHNINLHADYQLTDTLKIKGQISSSKSTAEYSLNRVSVQAKGITSTIDYSKDPVYPVISSPTDFTNPMSWNLRPDLQYNLNNESDKDDAAKLVLEWDYNLGDWTGVLKTGFNYVESTKTLEKRNGTTAGKTQTLPNGLTFNTMTSAAILANMQPYMPISPYAKGAGEGFPKNWSTFSRSWIENFLMPDAANAAAPVDYNTKFLAEEDVTSYYAQTELKGDVFERQLKVNLGVRYSETETSIDNYKLGTGAYVPNHLDGSYDNVLPSLNLAYDISDDVVVRASWGKTITRAGLIDIAATTVIPNSFNPVATQGNPNLKPQLSEQYDLTAEWYFNKGGILSAGAFWKDITDKTLKTDPVSVPFSSLGLPDTALGNIYYVNGGIPPNMPITLTSFFNGGKQKLSGLEFAYQQNFTFLPAPFDGLGAVASYTKVDSDGLNWKANSGALYNVSTIPKNGYTATGFYEKGPLSVRLTYSYKDKSVFDNGNSGNDLQRWKSSAGYLDATFGYKLTDYLELKLDVLNLNNALIYEYFENPEGKFGSGESRKDYAKYNGRTVMVGVRGSF
jgi:TonB-dependent receptor